MSLILGIHAGDCVIIVADNMVSITDEHDNTRTLPEVKIIKISTYGGGGIAGNGNAILLQNIRNRFSNAVDSLDPHEVINEEIARGFTYGLTQKDVNNSSLVFSARRGETIDLHWMNLKEPDYYSPILPDTLTVGILNQEAQRRDDFRQLLDHIKPASAFDSFDALQQFYITLLKPYILRHSLEDRYVSASFDLFIQIAETGKSDIIYVPDNP